MSYTDLRRIAYECLLSLATDEGINASGKDEVYGCIFGRDSAITILKILKVYNNQSAHSLLELATLRDICKRALLTLVTLQGKTTNVESGEEPGKFIHEFRKDKYDHLINNPRSPWYLYPDGMLRNYDSLDATPLTLIALHRYWKTFQDHEFLIKVLPAVESGLNWIITYGDLDKDILLEYEFPKHRKHGGLLVQSWTDSHESIRKADGRMPQYPIAPVEVQGYAWLALKLWSDFYSNESLNAQNTVSFAKKLEQHANTLKEHFNRVFMFKTDNFHFPAQALDGVKNQIQTITGNPLLLLWATYRKNGNKESILDDAYIEDLIKRSFQSDLFDADAGIRTMSTKSATFNPRQDSYHNGSYWPKLNGMSHEGLLHWGHFEWANKLKEATLKPLAYFGTPIELYIKDEQGCFVEYKGADGQVSCRQQAWSAAVTLDMLTT